MALSQGKYYETEACQFLVRQRLKFVVQGFRAGRREVDLIMRDGKTWVFVEVKYRKNSQFGGAIQALSLAQQQRLHQAALAFFQQRGLNESRTPCRFDLVAITGAAGQEEIQWFKNAF